MMKKINYSNTVIEVLNLDHGKKVIQWWKDQGVDTGIWRGTNNKENDNKFRFYGVINGNFNNYSIATLKKIDTLHIIELPEEMRTPKFGEEVLVWDNNTHIIERIYLGTIEGIEYPHLVVATGDENNFKIGHRFSIGRFKFMKPLENNKVELTLQDISDGKGVGIDPRLIKIIK